MVAPDRVGAYLAREVSKELALINPDGIKIIPQLSEFEANLAKDQSASYLGLIYVDKGYYRPFLNVVVSTRLPFDHDNPRVLEAIKRIDALHRGLSAALQNGDDPTFRGFASKLTYIKWGGRPSNEGFDRVLKSLAKGAYYAYVPPLKTAVLGYRNFP